MALASGRLVWGTLKARFFPHQTRVADLQRASFSVSRIPLAMDESTTTGTVAPATQPTQPKQKTLPGDMLEIVEGAAKVLQDPSQPAFYNKVQCVNRDLSINVIALYDKLRRSEIQADLDKKKERGATVESEIKGLNILEALAASGLRSIRYFKEIPNVNSILVNDFSHDAVEAIKRNIALNNLDPEKVIPNREDASMTMYRHRSAEKQFDVIDLDPYGSAVEFLDGAVQAVSDGGLLCVTCTDMAVLSGKHNETTYSKYGIMPLTTKFCHEMALRILLAHIQHHAGRYRKYVVPLVSFSIDFYIRVFVRVYTSANEVKKAASKMMHTYQCCGCQSFVNQRIGKITVNGKSVHYGSTTGPAVAQHCPECGNVYKMGGPFWADPIFDPNFAKDLLNQVKEKRTSFPAAERVIALLEGVNSEFPDIPFYHSIHHLCNVVHCSSPRMAVFRSAIMNAGYRVSGSHCTPLALKTDAPNKFIWDMVRAWVKLHPVKSERLQVNSPGAALLLKEPTEKIDFTICEGADVRSAVRKVPMYLPNPEDDWGPKARAGRKRPGEAEESLREKSKKIQEKKQAKKARALAAMSGTSATSVSGQDGADLSDNEAVANDDNELGDEYDDNGLEGCTEQNPQ